MTQPRNKGLADLHMHTNASDGYPAVEELLDYVAEQGRLHVIAITDHDVLEASLWAYEHRAAYPFDIVPGVEITSRDGHVLGLWVTRTIPRGLSLAETAAAIHEQGGLAVMAHPFEFFVHFHRVWRYFIRPQVLVESGIDAVEVHNSGAPSPGGNRLSRRMARILQLPVIGSSDAHTLTAIACGVTIFEGHTALDLRDAIENGQTYAEGKPWPIIDYLRLLPTSTRRRSSVSLETNTL